MAYQALPLPENFIRITGISSDLKDNSYLIYIVEKEHQEIMLQQLIINSRNAKCSYSGVAERFNNEFDLIDVNTHYSEELSGFLRQMTNDMLMSNKYAIIELVDGENI